MNQELILQLVFIQGQQALLDAHAALVIFRRRRNRRIRSCWVRPWLSSERRLQFGRYDRLLAELRMEDQQSFFNFLRMPPEMFDELLNRVGPRIRKMDTHYRKALEPGMKLASTIRHLASGDKYPTLQYAFRVARSTICIIPEAQCVKSLLAHIRAKLFPVQQHRMNGVTLLMNSRQSGMYHMPAKPSTANMFPSDVLRIPVPCTTIKTASFQSCFLHW